MPHPILPSSTLRRLTVVVSLVTLTLFVAFAAAISSPQSTIRVWVLLPFVPISWLHYYSPGYVSHSPTALGRVHEVVTPSWMVRECIACSKADGRDVARASSTQLVVAGIPLSTTNRGKNEYYTRYHGVGFSLVDEAARGECGAEGPEGDSGKSAELND